MTQLSDIDNTLKKLDKTSQKLDEFYQLVEHIQQLRAKIATVSEDYENSIQQAQAKLEEVDTLKSLLETELKDFEKRRGEVYEVIASFQQEKADLETLKKELLSFQQTQQQAFLSFQQAQQQELADKINKIQQQQVTDSQNIQASLTSLQENQQQGYHRLETKINEEKQSLQLQIIQLMEWVEELKSKKFFGLFSKKSK